MTTASPPSSSPEKNLSSIRGEAHGGRPLIPIFLSVFFLLSAGLSWGLYQQQGVIRQKDQDLQQAQGQIASLKGELVGYQQVAAKVERLDEMFDSFQEDGKTIPFTKFVAAQQERVTKLEESVQTTERNDAEAISGLKATLSSLEARFGEADSKLQALANVGTRLAQAESRIQTQQQAQQQVQTALAETREQLNDRLTQQTSRLTQLTNSVQNVSDLEVRAQSLGQRLSELEEQVGRKATREDLSAKLTSVDSRFDRLESRITDLERQALSSVVLREGQEDVIPGVGLTVKLQRINPNNAIDVVVKEEGSESMQLTMPLGQQKVFDYKGGRYKITVKRIVKVPGRIRDFLQVTLETA